MDKLNMQTADAAEENIRRIAQLFPGCVTETKDPDGTLRHAIDFDKLRAELGEEQILPEGSERYEFTWPGKRRAAAFAYRPIRAALRPCPQESVDFDNTHNLYIEGDNLDVLKLLRETYLGKVKMIYIDPPYNTGNDFVYKDDFKQTTDDYLAASGQFDDQGQRLETNTETNGRYHTDWLNMIYPRLRLARELLTDDGVIFISIDDHEVENLKKVCNEVFGEGNFVCLFPRVTKKGGKSSKTIAKNNDYVLMYVRNIEVSDLCGVAHFDEGYSNKDEYFETRGYYKANQTLDYDSLGYVKTLDYPIEIDGEVFYAGGTKEDYEKRQQGQHGRADWGWRWSKSLFEFGLKYGFIEVHRGGSRARIYTKTYQNASIEKVGNEYKVVTFNRTKPLSTLELTDNRYSNDNAKKVSEEVLGKGVFEYTKHPNLIITLAKLVNDKSSLILDFFSGSATTAHAVMQLNAEDGGNRRFIMVQVPEPCAETSEAYKAGYATICEIGKERIRRAGKKIREEMEAKQAAKRAKEGLFAQQDAPALDTGFRVLKLASTNMEDVYYQPRDVQQRDLFKQLMNVKGDRTPLDLLFQVMLDLGITLDADIREEEIAGRQVYRVNDTQLVACFEPDCPEAVVEAISRLKPLYAVVREPKDDATMTNFDEFFKTNSPDTHRRVL